MSRLRRPLAGHGCLPVLVRDILSVLLSRALPCDSGTLRDSRPSLRGRGPVVLDLRYLVLREVEIEQVVRKG